MLSGRRRDIAVGAISLVLLTTVACTPSDSTPEATGKYGTGVDLSFDKKRERAAKEGGTLTAPPRGAPSQPVAGAPAPPPPRATKPSSEGGPAAVDFAELGSAASALLRSKNHERLVVEVNAVKGYEPSSQALATMRQRLTDVVDKPSGIKILPVRTFDSSKTRYTMDDVAKLEQQHRRQRSHPSGPVAALHVLYLNGRLGEGTLGVAYYSTSVVVMQEEIRSVANPAIPAPAIEKAVLVHEVGHVLGLVNIGYTSPRDHEDPDHKGHSKNRDSVMYFAVETLNVLSLLAGEPPNRFDADDLADLADRRAGKY